MQRLTRFSQFVYSSGPASGKTPKKKRSPTPDFTAAGLPHAQKKPKFACNYNA